MRRSLLFILLLFFCYSTYSQETALKGIVINSATKQPIDGVSVSLRNADQVTITASDGSFFFDKLSPGGEFVVFSSPDVTTKEMKVNILNDMVNDLGMIPVVSGVRNLLSEGSLILIDEENINEAGGDQSDYNVSSLMISSNDVYLSNSAYDFSAMRFKVRGYENRYVDSYINGVNFSDPERGGFSYGMVGGLNDATRSKDIVNAMESSSYTYSQVGGASNINAHAGNYAPGGKVSVAYTNRSYKLRGSALYSTGMQPNGWAFTGSVAYRWADEGFIDGTFYNSLAGFFAVEKLLNPSHKLSLTAFAAPTQRGQSSAAPQQLMDIKGHYYNSYWGYQNGEKRNSRVVTTMEPSAILSHTWTIDKNSKLTTGLGYRYSKYGSTALARYNAYDPRPDYYRNLPGYKDTPELQESYAVAWLVDPTINQVDWNEMYQYNYNVKSLNLGSAFIVEERHNDQMNLSLNSTFNTKLTERITFTAGLEARTTKGMHYKTVSDLLGGDYFLNINQFEQRNSGKGSPALRYDLNNPDTTAIEGDRFGYDYDIHVNSANVWLQNTHRYNKWDINYGFKIGFTEFYRTGHMRNGLAPDNSYGEGAHHSFIDQSAKLGIAYKISGRHILSGNVSYTTQPPLPYNAYLSPRVKDTPIPNMENENIFAADLSYNISTPILRGRITAFQTNFYDQARMYNMYSDADGTFVNYALTGINKIHRGFELGMEVKVNSNLSFTAIGTLSEYYYSNRPTGTLSAENGSISDRSETVYLKNFYVSGTPQTAGALGAHYFYNYWFFDLTLSGFNRTYIDPSPIKRTESAISKITANSNEELEKKIEIATNQEKFAGGTTLDFSIGKMFRIQRKYTLNVNLQFCNILNNEDLKSGGYEYNRIDLDDASSNKFPSYYYYAQGFNCFLNAGFRF